LTRFRWKGEEERDISLNVICQPCEIKKTSLPKQDPRKRGEKKKSFMALLVKRCDTFSLSHME